MTGWSFFMMLVGVALATAELFQIADAIERPASRRRRSVFLFIIPNRRSNHKSFFPFSLETQAFPDGKPFVWKPDKIFKDSFLYFGEKAFIISVTEQAENRFPSAHPRSAPERRGTFEENGCFAVQA